MSVRSALRRLRPDHLAGQIALLILAALVLFHAILVTTFQLFNSEGRRWSGNPMELAASVALALDYSPVAEREKLLSELSNLAPDQSFSVQAERPDASGPERSSLEVDVNRLRSHLWNHADVFLASGRSENAAGTVAIALRKGGYVLAAVPQPQRSSFSEKLFFRRRGSGNHPWIPFWARAALFFFVCTTILIVWASNAVVAPLVQLAKHAERFPEDTSKQQTLPEQGPREVRDLTRSINRMQARIHAMIATRAQVLAAVSHDLRTIITRIRLRSEFMQDKALRAKMLHDVDLMDSMLYKNLQYLRAESNKSDRSLIDIDSVLQTVSDQFADLGHDVTYQGQGQHRTIFGSLTETQRIFTNLVENAVTYAKHVEISLKHPKPNLVEIDVVDDGPGIPTEDKSSLFEPFVRGEPARTIGNHSGFGLGLSIVRNLVEDHGGSVELLDREPHGLIARVTLKCADEATDSSGTANTL